MELGLNKLPWKVQVGIFLTVAVAAVGGFYWYYVQDAQAAVTTQRQKLDAMKVEINKGKTTARQLPAFDISRYFSVLSWTSSNARSSGHGCVTPCRTICVDKNR